MTFSFSQEVSCDWQVKIHVLGSVGRFLVPIVFGNLLDGEPTPSKALRLDT